MNAAKYFGFLALSLLMPWLMLSFFAVAATLIGMSIFPLIAVSGALYARSAIRKRNRPEWHDA